jgi:2-oxoglutarate dehydrogenase E2 component (dihydrolipoamide succinyltransferase)
VCAPGLEDGTSAVVLRWLKQPGDSVREHEPLLELETDKVTVEVPSPAAGHLVEILRDARAPVEPGMTLARLRRGGGAAAPAAAAPAAAPEAEAGEPAQRAQLSPAVRRLLATHGLSVETIPATGRDGRVTAQDVTRFVQTRAAPPPANASATGTAAESRRVPHSAMRLRIAAHMVASATTAPHVTSVFEADLSRVLAHRAAAAPAVAARGVKLTLSAYFIAAAVQALRAVPEANASFHEDALEIFSACHIGVATALDSEGLIVPVLHHAERLDLAGIAQELGDLVQRARRGTLSPSDVRGGTFTLSNHGVSGSLFAAPVIINQPQVAILGIGKLQKRLLIEDSQDGDALRVRPMCYVSLTIDHRALDGFQANRFLQVFVAALETWGDGPPQAASA